MTFDLTSLGWDASLATGYARYAREGDHRPGRVAWVKPGVCTVLTEMGMVRASLAGSILAAVAGGAVALPGIGDWVAVRVWPDRRVTVEAVLSPGLPAETGNCQRPGLQWRAANFMGGDTGGDRSTKGRTEGSSGRPTDHQGGAGAQPA